MATSDCSGVGLLIDAAHTDLKSGTRAGRLVIHIVADAYLLKLSTSGWGLPLTADHRNCDGRTSPQEMQAMVLSKEVI